MPVPGTNDEEWDRLEPASALDALVELVLHGEYNGVFAEKRKREEMELRAAALGVFQVKSSDLERITLDVHLPYHRILCRNQKFVRQSSKLCCLLLVCWL